MRPVLILQADRERPPAHLADFLARAGAATMTILLDRVMPVPARALLRRCAGLVVLDDGGRADGATSALAHDLIEAAAAMQMPLLAQGSGAQLLARVAGASTAAQDCVEIGWLPVALRPEAATAPWLERLGTRTHTVFMCHRLALSLPPDAMPLLSGPQSRCAAFAIENRLAVHFHAELTQASLNLWLPRLRAGLPPPAATVQTSDDLAVRSGERIGAMRELADKLYSHWLSLLQP